MKKVEQEKSEPIVIDGTIAFKITLTDDEVMVNWIPGRSEDLAATLITKQILSQVKSDMDKFKQAGLAKDPKVKIHFRERYNIIGKGISATQAVANDMIMTVMNMAKLPE